MESTHTINVAKEFSKYPGGRYLADGDFSGERFREDWLMPALKAYQQVTIQLDGTLGYGSSFLEEAFGGLVRNNGLDPNALSKSLVLETRNETLIHTIKTYIGEAKPQKAGGK